MNRTLNPGELELRWGRTAVGHYTAWPNRDTWDLNFIPYSDLRTDTFPFLTLSNKLQDSGLSFKVYDNGCVWVRVPKAQKYGYILGWVAYVYNSHLEVDRSA